MRNRVVFTFHRRTIAEVNHKRLPPKVTVENQHSWVVSKVNPLITMSYNEQLKWKHRGHREILASLSILQDSEPKRILPCPYLGVLPSPKIYGYRNKDNFRIGTGADGNDRTVGQTVGSSSRQEVYIVPTEMLISTPKLHKDILNSLQKFILQVEVPQNFKGKSFIWNDGFIRSNRKGEASLSLCLNPTSLSLVNVEEALNNCREYFETMGNVHSLHVKVSKFSCYGKENFQTLIGPEHLTETLLNRTFLISPNAFFQVNPSGAEVLYSTIREMATFGLNSPESCILLDACCGTGTIGIILSDLFHFVIGFDVEEASIINAKKNAEENEAKNCGYLTGTAKSCFKYMSKKNILKADRPVVAVVNPSRSGLANSVMDELRSLEAIKRIVYVSCNPSGRCMNNFEVLCRKRRSNEGEKSTTPFKVSRAISVDMFPHTSHCEMVLAFDRL